MEKTALIVGCGYLGNALGAQLMADAWQVWGLRRSTSELAPGIRPLVADICRAAELKRVLGRRFTVVVVCAGAGQRNEERYRAVYLEGLRNVLAALGDTALLLLASSTRVYHQDDGSPVDEQSPTRPRDFAGRILLQAEQLVADEGRGAHIAAASVVRFGGIYGPGRASLLHKPQAGGTARNPMTMSNRIHRDDGAGVLAHLLQLHTQGKAIAPLYIGVDCAPTPLWQVRQWLAQQQGLAGAAANAKPPQAPLRGKACSNALLLASGYRFLFPDYRSGYGALLRGAVAAGQATTEE